MRSPFARRAVSDVVSFTLVFSLVAVTVGVVYVGGLGAIEERRDAERFDNAERAFDVLADNIEDIYEDGAPSRATEIKLADAGLSYQDPTLIDVEVKGVTNGSVGVAVRPIQYRSNGRSGSFVYEAGAIVRSERGGSLFVREPPLVFVDDGGTRTALLPLVQTRARGAPGVGGDTTVLVRAELALNEPLQVRTTPAEDTGGSDEYEVRFNVTTRPERVGLWHDYLEDEIPDSFDVTAGADTCQVLDTDGDGVDETVQCDIILEELFVSASRIDVSFE